MTLAPAARAAAALTTEPERPPRRWIGALRAAGISLACLVLGLLLMLTVFGVTVEQHAGDPPDRYLALLLLDLTVGLAAALGAGPVRRSVPGNLVLIAAMSVSVTAVPAAAVGLARIGARRRGPLDGVAIGLSATGALVSYLAWRWAEGAPVGLGGSMPWEVLLSTVFAGAALLWGRARGTREALITSLRAQARTAQRERDALEREHRALVAQAQSEQRTAIARDMHDSLSHHLSLIALHAGALEYREDLPVERRREAVRTIRRSAHAANTELREVLGALRADGVPLPTAGDLVRMVEQAREEGQDVRLTWGEEGAELDAQRLEGAARASVVTLVRITRELLTNARRHAPGARLDLDLRREGEEIVLRASNPVPGAADAPAGAGAAVGTGASRSAPSDGSGLGLLGARERALLLGGTLHIEDGAAGRFAVEARLPWRS